MLQYFISHINPRFNKSYCLLISFYANTNRRNMFAKGNLSAASLKGCRNHVPKVHGARNGMFILHLASILLK